MQKQLYTVVETKPPKIFKKNDRKIHPKCRVCKSYRTSRTPWSFLSQHFMNKNVRGLWVQLNQPGSRCQVQLLLAMATWSLSHGSDPSVKRAQKTPTDRETMPKRETGKPKQPESMGFPLTQVYLQYMCKPVSSSVIEALSLLCGAASGSCFVCISSKFFLSTFISDTSQPDAINWIVTRSWSWFSATHLKAFVQDAAVY